MKIFHSLKTIKILLIYSIILSFAKYSNGEKIYLNNNFFKNEYSYALDFNVFVLEDNFNNYIKIVVEPLNNNNEIAINYYQRDSKFKDRNQLSYGFSNSTFMWLNKNQFKNNFYFSINCKVSYDCEYKLKIYKTKYAEINMGDIYTYYVTEENKDMTFLINLITIKNYVPISDKNKISIWARSSNNITSKLEPNSYTNLITDKYQAYLFYRNEIDFNKNYYLKVEGNIGDLINVGSLFFDENNTNPIIIRDLGTEITGFFKENIFEKNCFKFINANNNSFIQFIYDFEIENSLDQYNITEDKYYTLVCLNFNKKFKLNKYLYTLQYVRNNNENNRLNYLISPLILGKNYKILLNKKETIGLIPNKPDIDFNFLTYHAKDLFGACRFTIYECSNYPFCNLDNLSKEKTKIIFEDGSYSISYNKTEYNNITPISKTQKVLLINDAYSENNLINVNFYTNKNKIFIFPQIKFYNYLGKNNEDNLLINLPYNNKELPDSPYAYLSLEIISGNASIDFQTPESSFLETMQNNNKKSFIFRFIQKNENLLKIKANKNTVYSIIYILEENKNKRLTGKYIFPIGNNFLYEIKNISGENFQYFNNKINYIDYTYFIFHPINCEIKVENNNKGKSLNKYKGFSYDIEQAISNYSFIIKREDKDTINSCLVYASTFTYNKDKLKTTFLILPNKISQYYFFHDDKEINFLYYHTEIDNDLLVDFKMNHSSSYIHSYDPQEENENYRLIFYINKYSYTKYIYNNTSFNIPSFKLKNFCTNENQFCLIRILVQSKYKNDSIIELNITSIEKIENKTLPKSNLEPNLKPKANFWKDNLKLISIISGSVLIFIIILIIIICACIKKKNNKDLLALKVNKVSFEEERRNRNKAYENGLLY